MILYAIMLLKEGDKVEFYRILEQIMEEKNMSIPEVACACEIPDSTIRSIITRKSKNVSLDVAFKLSNGLNVSLERLNGDIITIGERIRDFRERKEITQKELGHQDAKPHIETPKVTTNKEEKVLLENYNMLTPERQKDLLNYSHFLAAQQETEYEKTHTGTIAAFSGRQRKIALTDDMIEDIKRYAAEYEKKK